MYDILNSCRLLSFIKKTRIAHLFPLILIWHWPLLPIIPYYNMVITKQWTWHRIGLKSSTYRVDLARSPGGVYQFMIRKSSLAVDHSWWGVWRIPRSMHIKDISCWFLKRGGLCRYKKLNCRPYLLQVSIDSQKTFLCCGPNSPFK